MVRFRKRASSSLFLGVITLIIIFGAAYLLGWSSLYTVKSIEIEGSTAKSVLISKLKSDQISPEIGAKLARIQTRSIMGSLTQLDWISSVEVDRNWFSRSIVIKIKERSAVAKAVIAQSAVVNFDAYGEVFKPTSPQQLANQQSLPTVSIQNSSKAQLAKVALLFTQIPKQMRELRTNLSSMSVSNSGLVQMQSEISGRLLQINWGQLEEIEQKCQVLEALLQLPENKGIKRVDLSQPDLPIVS